ncbi:MAG: glutamine-hydrolyzing GMP synthase, partial [Alkaliphilus sp.]|nr:glutamine-hydrolyzing GMP synthase [Alkaliphilus sp.]
MNQQELVLIIDFGGQYKELIARRVRENNVYCEVVSYRTSIEKIKEKNPKGIIFTGGPASVYAEDAPSCDSEIFQLGIPVLGICYGGQLMAQMFKGKVNRASSREYGRVKLNINDRKGIFEQIPDDTKCWMSHTDFIEIAPEGFKITATTESCPVAAMANTEKKLYAVQFHPEVEHTEKGKEIIHNFLFEVCQCAGNWNMRDFAEQTIEEIKEKVGNKKVLCALSGGVDSSVAAVLVHKAVGDQLTCIFVDHGLLRKDEGDQVEQVFREMFHMNLIRVNAQKRFLSRLEGITDPEEKRKIIGEEFIRVFEEESSKLGEIDFLVQGTVYPDVIESGTDTAAVIKSHHNVGGLPKDMKFELIEPLRQLFKDEVRKVGEELGISGEIVWRQPFPGPGLAIRVLGEIIEDKLHIVRESDAILRDEIKKA